ncbi:MAG: methyltransferase [Candidatus Gastranaerophilales bacterium]|nr:methyltransferase [Candidatus Gastranaerophilales bacterium]
MTFQQYVDMQKKYYNCGAKSENSAKSLVGIDYDTIAKQSRSFLAYILNDFMERRALNISGDTIDEIRTSFSKVPKDIKVLDFGCGVGRLMREMVKSGFSVDGADISEQMINFAKEDNLLKDKRFYLTNGNDCGDVADNYYDLIYSMITVQHICVRGIRNNILESFYKTLKDNGVFYIQMKFYPEINKNQINREHACWAQDRTDVKVTNGFADVWITPDQLVEVYQDFSTYFNDISFQFVEFNNAIKKISETEEYKFSHIMISGSKTKLLSQRVYKTLD